MNKLCKDEFKHSKIIFSSSYPNNLSWAHSGVVVAEGGQVTIDTSKLDASNLLERVPEALRRDHRILYRVISFPRHGVLNIRGLNLSRYFSQGHVNNTVLKV